MPSLAVPTGGPAVPLLDPSTALIGAQPSAEVYTALATRVESLLNLSPTASVTPVVSDEGDSLYDPVGPFYSDVGAIDDPCQDVPSLMRQFMDHSLLINNSTDDSKLTSCFLEFVTACPSRDMTACPTKFDGVSCWPETPPGTMRAIPCFDEFNGVGYDSSENATLYCHANGTWSEKSFYDLCLNTTLSTSESLLPTFNTTKTIFYVGNSASLAAVTVALWIFLTFKDLRCLRNSIHINLLLTYFLHNLFWIIYAAIQPLMGMIVSCSFYVALTYFVFTNFMWMFVEGLYLYMLVVITFSVEDFRLRVYTLIGWGIPIPIIISWVLVKLYVTQYQDDGSDLSEENEMGGMILDTPVEEEGYHCPLIYETPIDWMHQGPVMLLLSTNIIFLMRIMWVLITKLRSANTVETQRYRKATKALLVLIPLLGLTYMLLIALPQELEHIRAILLSTQGFWVALFYCFLNSEVQNSIRHHIERWKTARGIGEVQRGASIRQGIRDGSPRSRSCLRRRHLALKFYLKFVFTLLEISSKYQTTLFTRDHFFQNIPHKNRIGIHAGGCILLSHKV
ncbi:unnamed protein product, partial [Meganyctiphanes norvegica]